MFDDEIVEEVRETRRRIFEECGDDFDVYMQRMKEAAAKYQDRLVGPEDVLATREPVLEQH